MCSSMVSCLRLRINDTCALQTAEDSTRFVCAKLNKKCKKPSPLHLVISDPGAEDSLTKGSFSNNSIDVVPLHGLGGQIPDDTWRLGNVPTFLLCPDTNEDLNSRLDLLTGCRGTTFETIGDIFFVFL